MWTINHVFMIDPANQRFSTSIYVFLTLGYPVYPNFGPFFPFIITPHLGGPRNGQYFLLASHDPSEIDQMILSLIFRFPQSSSSWVILPSHFNFTLLFSEFTFLYGIKTRHMISYNTYLVTASTPSSSSYPPPNHKLSIQMGCNWGSQPSC